MELLEFRKRPPFFGEGHLPNDEHSLLGLGLSLSNYTMFWIIFVKIFDKSVKRGHSSPRGMEFRGD